jgi:hypothetical protein
VATPSANHGFLIGFGDMYRARGPQQQRASLFSQEYLLPRCMARVRYDLNKAQTWTSAARLRANIPQISGHGHTIDAQASRVGAGIVALIKGNRQERSDVA